MSEAHHRLEVLTRLARRLTARLPFEQTLEEVSDHAAQVLGVERVTVRLFDASRTTLIAIARAGRPLHATPQPFRLGEGLLGWIAEQGAPLRLADAPSDPRFAPRPGMETGLVSFLGVPLSSGSSCVGVLAAVSDQMGYFDDEDERLATLLAAIAAPWVEVARLSRLSSVDPLTGALNRRGFDESYPELAGGVAEPLSVVMADLDHFKRVNDMYGHVAGDEVLRIVGSRLGDGLRKGDAVVRFGGEEFLILLPGAPLNQGVRVAERARRAVSGAPVLCGASAVAVTASFGVAERRADEARDAVVARADEALYRAKGAGRNRVERAP